MLFTFRQTFAPMMSLAVGLVGDATLRADWPAGVEWEQVTPDEAGTDADRTSPALSRFDADFLGRVCGSLDAKRQ